MDGKLVLDKWHPNNGVAYGGTTYVPADIHDREVEHYEHGGNALLYVWWEPT